MCVALVFVGVLALAEIADPLVASVVLPFGRITGTRLPNTVSEYLGIPYAAPPKRVSIPYAAPPKPWIDAYLPGGLLAQQYSAPCMQTHFSTNGSNSSTGRPVAHHNTCSEDCLTLDVYAPNISSPESGGVAVMVNDTLGASPSLCAPHSLAMIPPRVPPMLAMFRAEPAAHHPFVICAHPFRPFLTSLPPKQVSIHGHSSLSHAVASRLAKVQGMVVVAINYRQGREGSSTSNQGSSTSNTSIGTNAIPVNANTANVKASTAPQASSANSSYLANDVTGGGILDVSILDQQEALR
jgi:hypothetical protein